MLRILCSSINFGKIHIVNVMRKIKLGEFYRKKMALFPEIQYFTSLTNYFGIQGDNINYVYHFGQVR